MFLTLHLQITALEITRVHACTERETFLVNPDDIFFKRVASRHYSIIRIIAERKTDDERQEYHCVDFTGASFLITATLYPETLSWALNRFIGSFADRYRLMTYAAPMAVDVGDIRDNGDDHSVRQLTQEELYYHTFAKTLVADYFTGT